MQRQSLAARLQPRHRPIGHRDWPLTSRPARRQARKLWRNEKYLEGCGDGSSNGALADGLAFELAGDTSNKGRSITRVERLGSVGDLQPLNVRNGDGHERASFGLRRIVLCA